MEYLLAWYRLIFFLPLAVGVLLVVGVVAGVAEFHHELDLDGDAEPHADLLSFLGFGRVPVAMLLMVLLLLFGGIGTVVNFFLEPLLRVSGMFAGISFVAAVVGAFLLTGSVARLVRQHMPTLETKTITKHDIVGSSGALLFATENLAGMAIVRKDGDIFQVRVRTVEELSKGQQILITCYDDAAQVYEAVRDPVHERVES